MKNTCMLILLMVSLLVGCQPNANPQQENTKGTGLPESLPDIEDKVAGIQASRDTLQERGPITVTRGDENWEVYAYYEDQNPRMLRALYGKGEQNYYFVDRRIVRLHEFANLDNGQVQERVFSYNENQLVEAKSRTAPSRDQLAQQEFRPYESPYGEMDFRLDVNQVNGSATGFIYGE